MRKFLFLLGAAGFITSCNNGAAKTEGATDTTMAKTEVALPYTASYSSSFKMGNPEYSAMVLQGS
jgi:hypothetical protein